MKKIISLGIASAVLALTAISASAGVVVKTDSAVAPGATITVNFVADADGEAISFRTNASGATLVDAKAGGVTGLAAVSDDKMGIAIVGSSFKSGDVLFTQTYTVSAKEGEAVSINVTDLEGTTGVATNLTVTATATTSSDSSSETSDSTDSGNSGDSSSTDSGASESSDSGASKPDDEKNPGTGVALAVFPAVIAGAAVVVAKKKRG